MSDQSPVNSNSEDLPTVSIEHATTQTFKWQCEERNYPKSFRFHRSDFEKVLENPAVEYVRTYPALWENETGNLEFRMLVVGVDGDGNDILTNEGASAIYDFALPCPNICGDSALNHDVADCPAHQ